MAWQKTKRARPWEKLRGSRNARTCTREVRTEGPGIPTGAVGERHSVLRWAARKSGGFQVPLALGGRGVAREGGSEGLEEQFRAVIETDEPVDQSQGVVEPALWRRSISSLFQ